MEDDWSEVSDATVRKRIQNRLAQRKHRQKEHANKQAHNAAIQRRLDSASAHDASLSLDCLSPADSRLVGPQMQQDGTVGNKWYDDDSINAAVQASFAPNKWKSTNSATLDTSMNQAGGDLGKFLAAMDSLESTETQPVWNASNAIFMSQDGSVGQHQMNDYSKQQSSRAQQGPMEQFLPLEISATPGRTVTYQPSPPRTEVQWLRRAGLNGPQPNTRPPSQGLKRASLTDEVLMSPAETEQHFSDCECRKRRRSGHGSSTTSVPTSPQLLRQRSMTPMSVVAQSPQMSRMARDYDTEIPQSDRSRYESKAVTNPQRPQSARAASPRQEPSDNRVVATRPRDHDSVAVLQGSPRAQEQCDELNHLWEIIGNGERPDPGVTKIFVIYMKERGSSG